MANEKKNGTLEEIIVEMLKEGKAVRIPLKDVVDKMQENVKAAEDAQEAVQPGTEKSEAVPQGGPGQDRADQYPHRQPAYPHG